MELSIPSLIWQATRSIFFASIMKSGSYVLNALKNLPSITSLERTPHQMRGLTPLRKAIMTPAARETYFSGISSGFVPSSARVLPTVLYFKTR
jgi:hypothetical protein